MSDPGADGVKQAKSFALVVGDLYVAAEVNSVVAATGRAVLNFTVTGGYPPYDWTFIPGNRVSGLVNSVTGDEMSDNGQIMPDSYAAGASFPGSSNAVIAHTATAGQTIDCNVYIRDANGDVAQTSAGGTAA